MPTPTLLVPGSSGLIGSEVCVHFAGRGWRVVGVDNTSGRCSSGRRATPAGTRSACRSSWGTTSSTPS
ncbi:MAG: NAD-dependent epimerase/dehydratase family protein [Cyanobium sp.]